MINCSCEIDEYSDLTTTVIRKARKPHKCVECRAEIKVGDRYEYTSGLFDGHWWSAKTCLICAKIRQDFIKCGFIGEMWSEIHEANCTDDECICP